MSTASPSSRTQATVRILLGKVELTCGFNPKETSYASGWRAAGQHVDWGFADHFWTIHCGHIVRQYGCMWRVLIDSKLFGDLVVIFGYSGDGGARSACRASQSQAGAALGVNLMEDWGLAGVWGRCVWLVAGDVGSKEEMDGIEGINLHLQRCGSLTGVQSDLDKPLSLHRQRGNQDVNSFFPL